LISPAGAGRNTLAHIESALRKLAPVAGRPIRVEFSKKLRTGVHAATFIRKRRIVLDFALMGEPAELRRILVHELFHFAWLRMGNSRRWSFEDLLRQEAKRGVRGELGWSAEWRKDALTRRDSARRSRRWREYACESFCDTAAWRYAAIASHEEFTLAGRYRAARREWFRHAGLDAAISI
jgi:hypothetical protein